MLDDLWNEYLSINEYRMTDYDRVVLQIIKSIEKRNEIEIINNT